MNPIQHPFSFFLFLLPLLSYVHAQTATTIDGFSDQYYVKVEIDKGYEQEVFQKGWIGIYDKTTQQKLIHVAADELAYDDLSDEPQTLFLFEDVNFDGQRDFVVQDGQKSCYHQPSYQVFLAKGQGFVFSEAFSRLGQAYCGMFQIDPAQQLLITYAKSGCCWHEKSEFRVENDEPVPVRVIQEDGMSPPFHTITTQVWKNGNRTETVKKTLNLDYGGYEQLLAFTIAKNGKKVVLFSAHDKSLQYAFLDHEGKVEFDFPSELGAQSTDFWFKEVLNSHSVAFSNGTAHYEIYQGKQEGQIHRIGIQVKVNGKTYLMVGDPDTVEGDLAKVPITILENVGNR